MSTCSKGHEVEPRRQCRQCATERVRQHRDRKEMVFGPSDWHADDVDHVAVERAMQGQKVGRPLHPRELTEVARRIHDGGGGLSDLIRTVRCSTDRARRLLAEVSA